MPTNDDDNDKGNGKARSDEFEPKKSSEADTLDILEAESGECPPEVLAQFWQNVAAYEQAPLTTYFQ